MGAWIEIYWKVYKVVERPVAPRVGAWIEMADSRVKYISPEVAPRVGAWIEIKALIDALDKILSRSPRGSVD